MHYCLAAARLRKTSAGMLPLVVYILGMNIRLSPEQQQWLEEQVAAGRFSSVDDAIATAVADLMTGEDGDLTWAAPYLDEAREAAARGEIVSLDEAIADINAHV